MLKIAKLVSISVLNSGESANLQTVTKSLDSLEQTFYPDNDYDGFKQITVYANQSKYFWISEVSAWSVVKIAYFEESPTQSVRIPIDFKTFNSDFPMSGIELQCLGGVSYSYQTNFSIDENRYIKINFPNSISTIGIGIHLTQLYNNEVSVLQASGFALRGGGSMHSSGCIERLNSETRPIQSIRNENNTIIIDCYADSNLSSYFSVNKTLDMTLNLFGY